MKWNVEVEYITDKATMNLTIDGKLAKSLRFVQGLYIDESGKISDPQTQELMLGILTLMPKKVN